MFRNGRRISDSLRKANRPMGNGKNRPEATVFPVRVTVPERVRRVARAQLIIMWVI
jgi:hypothetical protein